MKWTISRITDFQSMLKHEGFKIQDARSRFDDCYSDYYSIIGIIEKIHATPSDDQANRLEAANEIVLNIKMRASLIQQSLNHISLYHYRRLYHPEDSKNASLLKWELEQLCDRFAALSCQVDAFADMLFTPKFIPIVHTDLVLPIHLSTVTTITTMQPKHTVPDNCNNEIIISSKDIENEA